MCGCTDSDLKFHGRDRLHHVPGEFTLVECLNCQFLFLSPRPDAVDIARFYPDDYDSFRPSLRNERSRLRRFERLIGLRRRASAVLRYRSSGHLLDVGCGTGDFLEVMQGYPGWQVRGLEPHVGAARRAREDYGISVDAAWLDNAKYAAETFDAVTMWDVLEHVPSPRDALRKTFDLLKPDGIVVIGVPNLDSFDAHLFGPTWAGLDVPRHFSVFSPRHLARCFLDAGFEKPTFSNLNGGYHSFVLSVRFWLDDLPSQDWRRKFGLAAARSAPFRLATMPYFSLAKQLRRGATIVAVARRPAIRPGLRADAS
jgi:2-polyprenyl-3-methyl-5-hydroxy-6-metoxy-1,4-benzoquinol methylase